MSADMSSSSSGSWVPTSSRLRPLAEPSRAENGKSRAYMCASATTRARHTRLGPGTSSRLGRERDVRRSSQGACMTRCRVHHSRLDLRRPGRKEGSWDVT